MFPSLETGPGLPVQVRSSLPSPSLLSSSGAHTAAHITPFWRPKLAPFWLRREKPEPGMLLSSPWLQPTCQTLWGQLPSSREAHGLTCAPFSSNISGYPCSAPARILSLLQKPSGHRASFPKVGSSSNISKVPGSSGSLARSCPQGCKATYSG